MSTKEKATKIVNAVLRELLNRNGLENAWDEIDGDIQEEIQTTLEEIVEKELNG